LRWDGATVKNGHHRTDTEKLHWSLALVPVDPHQLPFLEKHLLDATAAELPVLRDALIAHRSTLIPKLWSVLNAANPAELRLLPAASALASYDPDDARWEAEGGKVAQALVSLNPVFLGSWLDALRPVRGRLTTRRNLSGEESFRVGTCYCHQYPDRLRQ
jgi:eukaryotic-like serine/threonine-protein kinase